MFYIYTHIYIYPQIDKMECGSLPFCKPPSYVPPSSLRLTPEPLFPFSPLLLSSGLTSLFLCPQGNIVSVPSSYLMEHLSSLPIPYLLRAELI